MDRSKLLKRHMEEKLIKKLQKNKYKDSKEDLLFDAIMLGKNKLAKYIINNEEIDFNYKHNFLNIVELCILNNNIEILDLLKQENIDLYGEHDTKSGKINNLWSIRDLEMLKYFENNMDKKILKQDIGAIAFHTIYSSDYELLDYIIKNYNIKLSELKDDFLAHVERWSNSMKEREIRKRELVFFTDSILPNKRKYKNIRKKAFGDLDSIREDNCKIQKYYEYIKKHLEVK